MTPRQALDVAMTAGCHHPDTWAEAMNVLQRLVKRDEQLAAAITEVTGYDPTAGCLAASRELA